MHGILRFLLTFVVVFSIISCASSLEKELLNEPNTTIAMLKVRKLTFSQQYKLAEKLYKLLREKHLENTSLQVEIDYEIAFLYIKQKKYEKAKPLFENIINRYESDENSNNLPQWPYYLSKKLLNDVVIQKLEK